MSDLSTGQGPFFVSSEAEFNRNQGWENVFSYEGTEAECRAKQLSLVSQGANRVRLSPKGNGSWRVQATFPFNSDNSDGNHVDTMELETNMVLRSAYQSPVYRKRFGDVNLITLDSARASATLGPIADCVRKYQGGLPKLEADGTYRYWSGTAVASATSREAAIEGELTGRVNAIAGILAYEKTSAVKLFRSIAYRGTTSFIEFNQVFRRTVTAGNSAAVAANYNGVGRIWTSAEVTAWEGIPNDGWFFLPPDSQWHKDKPRVLSAYGQKTQLSYNYTEIVTATALHYVAHGAAVLIDL